MMTSSGRQTSEAARPLGANTSNAPSGAGITTLIPPNRRRGRPHIHFFAAGDEDRFVDVSSASYFTLASNILGRVEGAGVVLNSGGGRYTAV